MSPHRLVRVLSIVLLCLGLSLSAAQAQSREIQLCGVTQFVDLVVIGATIQETPKLILASTWIQIVPNLYTLIGGGAFIRDPLLTKPNLFIGGLVVVNSTNSFLGNPVCTVSPLIEYVAPLFTGTAVLTCVAGPSDPFQVTLQLQLTTCDEPGFPGGESASLESVRAQAEDGTRIPASEAPNEYVRP